LESFFQTQNEEAGGKKMEAEKREPNPSAVEVMPPPTAMTLCNS